MSSFHDQVVAKLDLTKEVTAEALAKAYNDVRVELVNKFHQESGYFGEGLKKAETFIEGAIVKEATTHPWKFVGAGLGVGLITGLAIGAMIAAPFIK